MALSLFTKLKNKYFQRFIRQWGREPQTPKEWMDIQNEAVRELNKTKGAPSIKKAVPPFQGFTPKVIQGGKGLESLIKKGNVTFGTAQKTLKSTLDAKKDVLKGQINKEMWQKQKKAENKAAIERFKQKFGKNEPKTVEDFTKKGDWDPSGMAEGGIARLGYAFGGKALKAIMDAWRANKTWGVGGPPYQPEKTSFNIKEMTKRNLGKEYSLTDLRELSKSPLAPRGGQGHFEDFNRQFKNIKASILKQKLEESKRQAELMIESAKMVPAENATAKKVQAQFTQAGKKQLAEANEGLKEIDIYMGMLQKKGRSVHYAGGLAPLVGEPSYAAHFYDDRIPYAGGSIVKGGKWFIKNLRQAYNELIEGKAFTHLPEWQREGLKWEILAQMKHIERGGDIPKEMIEHMSKDKRFKDIMKTRSTDPELYEVEDVLLNYGKKGDVVDEQVKILEKFDPKDRLPNFLGGRVSYSGGGRAGLPAVTMGTPQMTMQGPQMPTQSQPTGISGAGLQIDQNQIMQQHMQQNPWMQNQMQQGIGGTPQYKGQLRMPFGLGGMSRRAFMKLMAGMTALPLVGKGISKVAPKAATITETVTTTGAGTGMPAWFPKFVEKALKQGEDLTPTHAPQERVIVAETKLPKSDTPVYVEHDIVTGDTTVDIGMGKHGWSDGYHGQPTRLHLKKGEIIEEGKMKGQKTPDEFVVEEAEFTGGHPENVKFEESSFNNYGEHGSDFSELEEFATGKVTKDSKPAKQVWEADWDDVIDPSDLPDDYASGGIARMLGE